MKYILSQAQGIWRQDLKRLRFGPAWHQPFHIAHGATIFPQSSSGQLRVNSGLGAQSFLGSLAASRSAVEATDGMSCRLQLDIGIGGCCQAGIISNVVIDIWHYRGQSRSDPQCQKETNMKKGKTQPNNVKQLAS